MWDDDSFDTSSYSVDSWLFDAETPAVAPILLGRSPRPSRTRENDEALLIALGLM